MVIPLISVSNICPNFLCTIKVRLINQAGPYGTAYWEESDIHESVTRSFRDVRKHHATIFCEAQMAHIVLFVARGNYALVAVTGMLAVIE